MDKVVGSKFLGRCLENFISKEIQEGRTSISALRRELVALGPSFPESVQSLIEIAKAIDSIEGMADRIMTNKAVPSLMELNSQLDIAVKGTASSSLATTRESYVEAKLLVGKEFGNAFSLYEAKLCKIEAAIKTFQTRASDIVEEITA